MEGLGTSELAEGPGLGPALLVCRGAPMKAEAHLALVLIPYLSIPGLAPYLRTSL